MNAEDERKQTKCYRKLMTYGILTPAYLPEADIPLSGKRCCGGALPEEEEETLEPLTNIEWWIARGKGKRGDGSSPASLARLIKFHITSHQHQTVSDPPNTHL